MPTYLKKDSIRLVEGALETYTLALHGISMPTVAPRRSPESRYAPSIGLLGSSVELLVKACLFQAKGKAAVFRDDTTFKFANEILEDFRKSLRDKDEDFGFLWRDVADVEEYLPEVIELISKFKTLLNERASGLHNAHGPSKDIVIVSANDVYEFISLLRLSWRLKPYLNYCPEPEKPTLDRFALIRDLNQKLAGAASNQDKARHVRDLYLVMPYIPEDEPDWLKALERVQMTPKKDDISYLVKNLFKAHSVFLYKDDKDGSAIPAKVDPTNPNALPIAPHHLKRSFKKLSDTFQAQSAVSNGAYDEGKLTLPSPCIVLDLYQAGITEANTGFSEGALTAQAAWPFVASAFDVAGTVYPFWFIIDRCFELKKLLSILRKIKDISGKYYKNNFVKVEQVIADLSHERGRSTTHNDLLHDSEEYIRVSTHSREFLSGITMIDLQPNEFIREVVNPYISGEATLDSAVSAILQSSESDKYKKYWVNRLTAGANSVADIPGLVLVMNTELMKQSRTNARKALHHLDVVNNSSLNNAELF
jgi:hypothetical protein